MKPNDAVKYIDKVYVESLGREITTVVYSRIARLSGEDYLIVVPYSDPSGRERVVHVDEVVPACPGSPGIYLDH